MRLHALSFAAILLALPALDAPLYAQKTPAPKPPAVAVKTPRARLSGVVIDSVNGRYLAGAEVVVQGANISLITDSTGKFNVDSLAPGTYQVGVFHPLLDTLGVSLATEPFHLG
ncbi:MAG: carboxypeptidase regulatory-like domain-containing protein, partial [Gemmatimonadaceae bacterium]